MKQMQATLATVSLSMAEPGQAVARNRAQVDFVIPDWVEFSAWHIAIIITVILVLWQSFILSMVATVDLTRLYFVVGTLGVFLWVCLDESAAALIRRLLL